LKAATTGRFFFRQPQKSVNLIATGRFFPRFFCLFAK